MIKVGIVGARGLSTLMGFSQNADAEVAAICDLNEELVNEQANKLNVRPFRVFEDMLEWDIDAVVIATPMQCHVPQALQALEAGKHVMSEVTAGVTMDELWWLKEAVEASGKTYFFAENYCYIPENQMIRNMVGQGVFGEIYFAEGEYLHDIKSLAKYENHKTSWRKYWQLGKRGNFYPTHSIGPIMQWMPGERITEVTSFGTGTYTSSDFRNDDTSITICRTNSGKLIRLRLDCISDRPHNMTYYSLQGTKASYEAERGLGDQKKIWIRGDRDGDAFWEPLQDLKEKYMPERYLHATKEQQEAGHNGGDFFIVDDFVNACLTGEKPEIDVYDGIEWSAVALLSQMSIENGGKTMKMPEFRK